MLLFIMTGKTVMASGIMEQINEELEIAEQTVTYIKSHRGHNA